jgi:uncharacterized metal-binding protein
MHYESLKRFHLQQFMWFPFQWMHRMSKRL